MPKTPSKAAGPLRPVTEQKWEDKTPNSKPRFKPKQNRNRPENNLLDDLSVSDIQTPEDTHFMAKISEEEVDRVNNSEFMEQDMENRIRCISGVQIQESFPIYQASFGGTIEYQEGEDPQIGGEGPGFDDVNQDRLKDEREYGHRSKSKNVKQERRTDYTREQPGNAGYSRQNKPVYGNESEFLTEIEESGTFENLNDCFQLQEQSSEKREERSLEGDKENYQLMELMENDEENLYRTTNHEDQDERFIADYEDDLGEGREEREEERETYGRQFTSIVGRSGTKNRARGESGSSQKGKGRGQPRKGRITIDTDQINTSFLYISQIL